MKIDSYDVTASSQRTYTSIQSTTTRASSTTVAAPQKGEENEGSGVNVSISDAVKEMQDMTQQQLKKQLAGTKTPSIAKALGSAKALKDPKELKMTLLEKMIEMLTGKKMKLKMFTPSIGPDGGGGFPNQLAAQNGAARMQTVDTWEIESFSYEAESISYQAQGVVKTADGKTINLDINMYMSREFAAYTNISIQSERPVCDPLVINYGGTAASLTGETFDFDLTMDGSTEKISMLAEGSGFLALDKNSDGKINDGSELFGPETGSGFDELRKYDADGNNWIDENDEIFSKLVVWSKDKDGNDQLFTLKELGVGAVYLGDVDTQFSFKDENNQTSGVMRSTSFFLTENGGAGTISHIDMAV